ncbi:MAG TPA: M1 family aminopeptidase [Flavipsychrobacter sp.]|nr:M1 family aminopeptidase [Flavipsychrobacter sp.]
MKHVKFLCIGTLAVLCASTGRAEKYHVAKTTIATPEEDYYDVSYVKLDIQATNTSTAIVGKTTTEAKVLATNMGIYAFELSSQLTIDSVKVNGNLLAVSSINSIRKVTLAAPLAQNSNFTADVWYHGQPAGGTGFFTNGLLNQTDVTIPAQVTHTVSAAFHSKDWWACKQSLSDKIDSADIWVTVPNGLTVASNGILKKIASPSPTESRYEWASRNPVDYYLLSFAVARYDQYNYYMHFAGGDSMLIQNFIYSGSPVLQNHKDELDSIEHMINYFSTLFGKYPFAGEKFGICQAPLSGGMENQTMVSLGSLNVELIAHELAHQWWGDHVTCHSLADMWLNEGWATYCEHLFLEKFHGAAAALTFRNQVFTAAMGGSSGSVYVDDTTDEFRIYDSRLTYNKGAAVAHMLRYLIDNDTIFFDVTRQYQQLHANSTATTNDLKNLASSLSGMQLDTFFSQWYRSEGYPTYAAKWYQDASGNVFIQLNQSTSKPTSVPVFKMPVELKLSSAQGDTVIRVLNTQNTEYYSLHWAKTMTGMSIDPDNHILNRTGLISVEPSLGTQTLTQRSIRIFPNPSETGWNVSELPKNARVKLMDVSGKRVWDSITTEEQIQVPANSLPSGTYILQISVRNQPAMNFYLSK